MKATNLYSYSIQSNKNCNRPLVSGQRINRWMHVGKCKEEDVKSPKTWTLSYANDFGLDVGRCFYSSLVMNGKISVLTAKRNVLKRLCEWLTSFYCSKRLVGDGQCLDGWRVIPSFYDLPRSLYKLDLHNSDPLHDRSL